MDGRIKRIKQKIEDIGLICNEPIHIEEIKNWEEKAGIKLPENLVLFYTKICNGCEMIEGRDLLKFQEWRINKENLKKEFMFDKYWIWEDEEECSEEKLKSARHGNIALINLGCGKSWNIIINGKEKGNMWFFADVGMEPCSPSMDFLEWFEYWLDGNDI